eukprot:282506_1
MQVMQEREELLKEHCELLRQWELTYRHKINKLLEEKTSKLLDIQKQFYEKLNEINDTINASTNSAISRGGSVSVSRGPSTHTIPSQLANAANIIMSNINDSSTTMNVNIPSFDLPPIAFVLQDAINCINNNVCFGNNNNNNNNSNNTNTNNHNSNNKDNNNVINSIIKYEFKQITNTSNINQQHVQDNKQSVNAPTTIPPSINQWPCTHCNAIFLTSDQLIQHLPMHPVSNVKITNVEKVHACDECGKILKSKNNLKRHMRTHTGDRPYACDMCGKAFAQSGTLTVHKRSHTGEKPYGCDTCNKAFATFNTLKNHQRVHTGEKPFQCQFCLKKFTQLGSLNTHLRCYCK